MSAIWSGPFKRLGLDGQHSRFSSFLHCVGNWALAISMLCTFHTEGIFNWKIWRIWIYNTNCFCLTYKSDLAKYFKIFWSYFVNKKVLLRDRKRDTARGLFCPWHFLAGGEGGIPVLVPSGDGERVLQSRPVEGRRVGSGHPSQVQGQGYPLLHKGPGTRGWGTPSPIPLSPERTWYQRLGYPTPPGEQKNKLKTLPSLILQMQAVNTEASTFSGLIRKKSVVILYVAIQYLRDSS